MYCKKCGAQILENETKCPKCGTDNIAENISAAGKERAIPRGFSSKKNILTIIIAAFLLIGGGITAVAVTSYNSPSAKLSRALSLAERYLSEQNYEQAVIEFQKVLEIEPMNVDAYLGLADAYLGLEQIDNALDILEAGCEKTSNERVLSKRQKILLEQARACFGSGDTDGALRIVDDILSYDSNCTDAYLLSADIYESLENYDRAVEILEIGLEKTQNEDISKRLNEIKALRALKSADKYLSEKKYEKAIAEYKNALSADEKCIRAYMGTADSYIAMENDTAAIDNLQIGFDQTSDADIKARLDELRVALALKNGTKKLSEKKFEEAAAEFQNALQIDEKCVDAYIGMADAFVGLNEFDKAIDKLQNGFDKTRDKTVKTKLDNLKVSEYLKKGNKLLAEKKYTESENKFENALKLDEKCVNAYIGIADSYIGSEKNDDAINILETGFDKTKDDTIHKKLLNLKKEKALKLGQHYLSQNEFNKAIDEFNKVIAIDNKCVEGYIGKSDSYVGLSDNDKGIDALQTGYDKTKNEDLYSRLQALKKSAYLDRARKYLGQKDYANAAPEYQKVLDIDNMCVEAYHGRSDALAGLGQKNDACSVLFNGWSLTWDSGLRERLFELRMNDVSLSPQMSTYQPLNDTVNRILSQITTTDMDNYHKAKACFDYLVNNCKYGSNGSAVVLEYSDLFIPYRYWEKAAYNMLETQWGVCNDYSAAFTALTRGLGFKTVLRTGSTHGSGHVWCVMNIDGSEYIFDPQIEDNLTNGYHSASEGGTINYIRFCKTYSELPGQYEPSDYVNMYD